jgi:hypothetical protein
MCIDTDKVLRGIEVMKVQQELGCYMMGMKESTCDMCQIRQENS